MNYITDIPSLYERASTLNMRSHQLAKGDKPAIDINQATKLILPNEIAKKELEQGLIKFQTLIPVQFEKKTNTVKYISRSANPIQLDYLDILAGGFDPSAKLKYV